MNLIFLNHLNEFILFLKTPKSNVRKSNESQFGIFSFILLLNSIVFFCVLAIHYLFLYIEKTFNFREGVLILETKSEYDKEYTFGVVIIACVLMPLIEEIVCRLPLLKKYAILLFICLVNLYFLYRIKIIPSTILIILTIFLIAYFLDIYFKWKKKYKQRFLTFFLNTLYRKNYKYLFYSLILMFSMMHFDNYIWTSQNLAYGISILGLTFITDLSFGYLMVRCGFIYSLSLHILWNTFTVLTELYL